jgi:hypothetical protein
MSSQNKASFTRRSQTLADTAAALVATRGTDPALAGPAPILRAGVIHDISSALARVISASSSVAEY